ncbi:putative bifunctional diguanylate cyclase/phosphodiesterase [Bacterioplanoides sp.]|uniref:putative bifunctional diguanylate cyclase/phosphodiesterase n=1 Tax=Bacterioplanoides sp. TaxID=2066072 RepID=UPI003B59D525
MKLPSLNALTVSQLRSPVWAYDVVGQKMVWANTSALELWEADSLEEFCSRDFSSDQSQAVQQTLMGYMERFDVGEYIDVWWEIQPKGHKKRVFCRLSGVIAELEDGSERMVMLLEGQFSPEMLSDGGIPSAAMAVIFDEDGSIISVNPPFIEQFGDSIENLRQILVDDISVWFVKVMSSNGRDIELNTLKGMRWHHAEVNIQQEISSSPCYVLTLIDIQERKLREIETANEARSDLLTGLMNRRGLLQYMSSHQGKEFSLFYIDLDGFKPINDSYGHNVGDALLRRLANVLMSQSGKKVCARLGGDEFVVVFLGKNTAEVILEKARQLLYDLSRPFEVASDCVVRVSASIGIACSPKDSSDIYELVIQADAAMYEAKKQGRNQAVVYQPGMESYLRRRTEILQYLDEAISNNDFVLHYQPIINGLSGETVLVEALLRWHHPTLGHLSPLEFIAVAEDSGKIARLESWVIQQVCRDLAAIRQRFSPEAKVTINISGAHMIQPGFIDKLVALLTSYNYQADDVVLELTESVLVPVVEENNPCLDQLVEAGFKLAIDDFGTGYSSLAYISQLPAHYVKIDKAFIDRLQQDHNTLIFIRDLCEKFNMQCIAEGVEVIAQKDILNNTNILLQQGYFYARPQPLEALTSPLEALRADNSSIEVLNHD